MYCFICGTCTCRYDQSIDLALRDWILQRIANNEIITRYEIKRKAVEMILPQNPDFQGSDGWITRFLSRHNLTMNPKLIGELIPTVWMLTNIQTFVIEN